MNRKTQLFAALSLVLATSAGIVFAVGHEDRDDDEPHKANREHVTSIKFESAPKAVRDAFTQNTSGKTPSKVERIKDEGVTKYEIEYAGTDGICSATYSDQGHLLESETAIKLSALPDAVLKELKKDYPDAAIVETEAVQLNYYEVEIVKNGKKRDVIVLATGDIEDQVFGGGNDEDDDHDD